MKKRSKEKHTKGWTLIRLIFHIGILALEVFGAYLLLIGIQEPIAHIAYMVFLVLPSVTAVVTYWNNYKKKSFISLIESDLEEDQRLGEQCGATYYIWKTLTLPTIVFNKKPITDEKLLEKYINLEIEREQLKKKINFLEAELEKYKEMKSE